MFETSDLYLAATVVTMGHQLAGVTKDGHRASFGFRDGPELRRVVSDYYAGRVTLEALSFTETLRRMKAAAMNVSREMAAVR